MKTLTLGNYRHTVTVIRSRRDEKRTFTQFSRYTSGVWDHPKVEEGAKFVDALSKFLESRSDIAFVFPIGETFLECIARHQEAFPSHVRFIMPDPATITTCLNKADIYRFVNEAGIPVPASERA